jgi:hypothetical protein
VTSLAGSAVLFGAQQAPVLVVAALAAAGAAWLLRGDSTSYATWLLIGLAGYTLFQIVPMPAAWVQMLAPASAAVWQGALRPFGAPPPSWMTLSIDPGATALEALKWFAYVCIFIAASGWRARRGNAGLALVVFGCGALVTVITLVHGVLDIQRVYGLYVPPTPLQWSRGPFVNANNLAGYVNLGLFAGVGLWLSPERKVPAWPFMLAVPIMISMVLLSESRGGILCLVLAGLWVGYQSLRSQRIASRRTLAGVALALVVALSAAVVLNGERLALALSDRDMHAKVSVWRWSFDLMRDFPVFGVGRGAFETGFEPYRRPFGRDFTIVFPYTENFPLQWMSDWGIVVGLLALAAFVAVAYRPFVRASRDPLAGGLAAGLAALLLQNFVDLALEIFSVTALALAAFAALGEASDSSRRRPTLAMVLAISGVVVAVGVVLGIGASPARLERQRVSKAYSDWVRAGAKDPTGFLTTLRAPMLRHPGEAYFPLVGSAVAQQAGGDPLRWIGRALERSPLDAHAHFRLADVMAARGARRQALLHLRLAALYDGTVRDGALYTAAGLAQTPEDLLSAFPLHLPGGTLLPELCKRTIDSVRVACWREVVSREPTDAVPKRELSAALADMLERAGPPCIGAEAEGCKAELQRRLGEVEAVLHDWRVQELRARELALQGKLREAATLALEHCPANREAAGCCERALNFARRARDLSLLGAAADRYSAAVCTDPRACALAHEAIGRSYEDLLAFGLALRHFSTAAEQDPNTERWLRSAEAAGRVGSSISAKVALDRAHREGGLSPEQRRRIEAVEAIVGGIPH